MSSFVYETLPALLALAGVLAVFATVLHMLLGWRERFRMGPIEIRSLSSGRRGPDGADVRWISDQARGRPAGQGCGASPVMPRTAPESPANTARFEDPSDHDLTYLDAVDRASALSFPASDPPALSGPA